MSYAHVENGEVTFVGSLPKSWRNISGLNLADDALLKENGWLPFTEEIATPSKYELKDGTKFTITTDSVIGVEQKRAMTDKEKTEHDQSVATQYRGERQVDYPEIGDQLDMLWHAIDGGTLDKTSDFYTSLKAIKDKHPKP